MVSRLGPAALMLFASTAPAEGRPETSSLAPVVVSQEDWGRVWMELARLRALPAGSRDVQAGRALEQRARVAIAGVDERASARGHLVVAQLARLGLSGIEAGPSVTELAHRSLVGFDGAEAWLLAEVLPSGAARVRAVLHALQRTDPLSDEQSQLAWSIALSEADELRLAQGALPLQRLLHERYHSIGSAINLALTVSRLGDRAALDQLLADATRRAESVGRPSEELWSCWGTALAGFGDETRARDYLGRALARGSGDAALVLARMDLVAGRLDAARSGFRPSILSSPPSPWGLRGWGTSLLPMPHTPPATELLQP